MREGALAPIPRNDRDLEAAVIGRREGRATAALFSLCFPYAATRNAEWIPYPFSPQERATNREASGRG